jgi:hypothetical protein
MSLPPISSLERLGNRAFSFYPPILNVEHNEWFFRRGSWAEILVMNSRSKEEIWIPRRFLGEISQIEDPVVIVGLVKELEYKAGAVWPHQRRVIEMPLAVGERSRTLPTGDAPAPVIGIRTESITDSRMSKLVGFTLLVGVVASVAIGVEVLRQGVFKPRLVNNAGDQRYLELTPDDDYFAVVRKLGPPAGDRWQSETGAVQFRSLWFPQSGCFVILMGDARSHARYIGTMDAKWIPIHWVELRTGGSTRSTLSSLPKF